MSLYDATADTVRWLYDRRIAAPPILDEADYFPQASRFARNWMAIRDEALAVARRLSEVPRFHELMQAQAPISANDGHDWRVFVLRAYGADISENLARCPVTARIVHSCPNVLSASFSFLAPGKHIPPHRGPFRGVVRCHLGLSMPRGADGRPGAILWIDGVEHRLDDGDYLSGTTPTPTKCTTGPMRSAWRCCSTSGAAACPPTCVCCHTFSSVSCALRCSSAAALSRADCFSHHGWVRRAIESGARCFFVQAQCPLHRFAVPLPHVASLRAGGNGQCAGCLSSPVLQHGGGVSQSRIESGIAKRRGLWPFDLKSSRSRSRCRRA